MYESFVFACRNHESRLLPKAAIVRSEDFSFTAINLQEDRSFSFPEDGLQISTYVNVQLVGFERGLKILGPSRDFVETLVRTNGCLSFWLRMMQW
jgi:hypothetical protein